ncbi:hypothetical protein [Caudoviricetes sp.]|nr:hypothetical protein [Caudoviricetes sp.]
MGFNLLAFAGGAAKSISQEIDKREEEAKAYALNSTKMMHERYTKTLDSNRQQLSSIEEDLSTIRSNFPGKFSEAQLYHIGISNSQRKQLVDAAKDPNIDKSLLDASQIAKITEDNPSRGTAMDRIRQAYEIPSVIAAKAAEVKSTGFLSSFGERAGATAAQKYAGMTGVSLEQMRGAQDWKAPTSTAEFDMTFLKSPKTTEDMVNRAEADVARAGVSFGEDSEQYKAAVSKLNTVSKFVPKVADTLDKRASRLNMSILDETDPTKKAKLKEDLVRTQEAIKGHAMAISTKSDKDKDATYAHIKTSTQDYANSRMRDDVGASWRKFVEFKTTKLDDGTTFTSSTKKVDMPLDEQQKMFNAERKYMMEGLVANKYIVDGKPLYDSVAEFARSFNIDGAKEPVVTAPTSAPAPAVKGLGARKPVAGSMTPKDEWVQAVPGRTGEQYDEAMKARAAAPMAVTTTPSTAPTIKVPVPATAIAALKANPTQAAAFDEKYGAGASKLYLTK